MCIITYVPGGVPIPEEGIRNGACANNHGHGWAVASAEHGIVVGKDMDKDKAIAAFIAERERQGPGSVGLFHSRLATHGKYGLFNVHPFPVPGTDGKTVLAHNGVLPSFWHPEKGDDRSDTHLFADITAPAYLRKAGIPSRRGGKEIGTAIGSYNKLVFLSVVSGSPVVRIVNAHKGIHAMGCWFSNDWFKAKRFGGGSWGSEKSSGSQLFDTWAGWDWTDEDEAQWQAERAAARKFVEETKALTEEPPVTGTASEPKVSSLDIPVVTDVIEDYVCDYCETRGSVHAKTMVCLKCHHCLDCFETVSNCTCFDWEEYLAKRAEDEALWISGVREELERAGVLEE